MFSCIYFFNIYPEEEKVRNINGLNIYDSEFYMFMQTDLEQANNAWKLWIESGHQSRSYLLKCVRS